MKPKLKCLKPANFLRTNGWKPNWFKKEFRLYVGLQENDPNNPHLTFEFWVLPTVCPRVNSCILSDYPPQLHPLVQIYLATKTQYDYNHYDKHEVSKQQSQNQWLMSKRSFVASQNSEIPI